MKNFIIGFSIACILNWIIIGGMAKVGVYPDGHPQVQRMWGMGHKIINFPSLPKHEIHVFNYSLYPCLLGVGVATKTEDMK